MLNDDYTPRDYTQMITGDEMRARFGLRSGQMREEHNRSNRCYRNKWWIMMIDGVECKFGYGDLNDDDLIRIQEELAEWEQFRAYNEHQWSDWQQIDYPQVMINHNMIFFQEEIKKLWEGPT